MGSPLPKKPSFITNCWHAIALAGFKFLFKVLNRVVVLGEENMPHPNERSVMILVNHISAIDPFLIVVTSMPWFSSVPWRAPAKEELFRIPLIKSLLATWGAFPVRRGKSDREAIRKMVELLNESVVLIFPEGTRSKDGKLLKGRPGVGKIIWDARPGRLLPVVVEGTEKLLPHGRIFPAIGKTTRIYYGKPLDLSRYYDQEPTVELTQRMTDDVMARIAEMQKEMGFKY